MSAAPSVRAITAADRPAVAGLVAELWGSPIAVAHGTVFTPATLPGVLAERDGRAVGLVTWTVAGDTLEVVTIDAFPGGADEARARHKPAIPAIGAHGIPLRDELDLEMTV